MTNNYLIVPQEFSNKETCPSDDYKFPGLPQDRNIRVYFEDSNHYFKEHLTDTRFEMVETEEEADIIWYRSHIRDYG